MSTPVKHHYVSQCHLKKFFNEKANKIFIYDKEQKNFYDKASTKYLFSEDFSNSIEINGEIDHSKLETELRLLFEDDFLRDLAQIEKFVDNPYEDRESAELALHS